MSISDDLQKGQPQAPATGVPENELALALQTSLNQQATALASLAQNYQAGVGLVAEQLAPFFTQALTGQTLVTALFSQLTQELSQAKPLEISSDIQPPAIELPKPIDLNQDRASLQAQLGALLGAAPARLCPTITREN